MTHELLPGVAVIGAGPAGLTAAEHLAKAGLPVTVFERMPSPGRKFLMAGRGGLNLTHSEPLDGFLTRYSAPEAAALVAAHPPAETVAWCESLGQPVFTGSTGRVFPKAMKASSLLRAWLARLDRLGVTLRTRAHWLGWTDDGALRFADGATIRPQATILALGGASWPRLGADGSWVAALAGVGIAPLVPANVGFRVQWSDIFARRFAGHPLKRIALTFQGQTQRGEAMITAEGIEGGAVYALSARLRDALAAGPITFHLDLRPDIDQPGLSRRLDAPRGGMSLANHLRRAGLPPVSVGLVQEALHAGATGPLSALVKAIPITPTGTAGLARAISTAGGVRWDELDGRMMLRHRPGCFLAGEMLDWEAPTGGYLLQACFASGAAAASGVRAWLAA